MSALGAMAAANTLLAGCVAGGIGMLIGYYVTQTHDLAGTHNALLGGCVAVTASCAVSAISL